MYQPGIWTPSKTISNAGRRGARLYQPGIWTPSKTPGAETRTAHRLYQPGNCQDEDMMAQMKTVPLIVSTWDLNAFENRSVLPAVVFVHCINLGFGHLRGSHRVQQPRREHYINLAFGHLRGQGAASFGPRNPLYHPGTWTPRRLSLSKVLLTADFNSPGIGVLRRLSSDGDIRGRSVIAN